MYSADASLLEHVEFLRLDASRKLNARRRADLGQFMTPAPIARFMASLFVLEGESLALLDAGAGTGSLTAAWVDEACHRESRPKGVDITAYELDPMLVTYLNDTLAQCEDGCERAGIQFSAEALPRDFIADAVDMLRGGLFASAHRSFDCAILNPPYRKVRSDSRERLLLRSIGVETSNLYTAFLAIVIKLLRPGGELVAITPRSFCNGPYFRPFRELFLSEMSPRRFHVFEARDRAFSDDDVLQENVIFYAVKQTARPESVTISSSVSLEEDISLREVSYDQLVRPDDPELFIHLVADELGERISSRMARFTLSLEELGLSVSTGRVVDFRARTYLRQESGADTLPLNIPAEFRERIHQVAAL